MNEPRLRVALLGHGYWGRNHARNVVSHPQLELAFVVDPAKESLERVDDLYPAVEVFSRPEDVISNSDVDIVIVATPLTTHFELAKESLKSSKHVVVTKPLAATAQEAAELAALAEENDRVLLVDNTFAYTGAVRKIRELIMGGALGQQVYCSSTRVNLGTYRRDSSVIWDLVPHDISILHAVGYGTPSAVAATAGGRMGGPIDQIAHLTLFFPNGCLAHVNVSWLAPVKMRMMVFGGTDKMIVYDDVEPSEKVKVYDKGVHFKEVEESFQEPPEYRLGDMWAPQLDQTEALYVEMDHLVRCVHNRELPITDGGSGVDAVRILQAATRSAEKGGELTALASGA